MRGIGRIWLVGVVVCCASAFWAAGAQAEFGIAPGHFASGACAGPKPNCEEPDLQAASSPLNTFSTFTLNTNGEKEVEGRVRRLRVDSPPGLVTNPHAIPTCEVVKLEKGECTNASKIGENIVVLEVAKGTDIKLEFPVYNVVPPAGAPSDFAYFTGTSVVQIVGGVSWRKEALPGVGPKPLTGDSHEYYKIEGIAQIPPLVSSTLILYGFPEEVTGGGAPDNAFIRIPGSCTGPSTTYLEVESYASEAKSYSFTPVPPFTPIPLETMGCNLIPFEPSFALHPETTQSDAPDGVETVTTVPQNQKPHELATAHVRTVQVTLPEGMTLNPSAAHGIEGCTPEQVEITPTKLFNTCPAASKIGTVLVETPALLAPKGLPAEHEGVLSGNIYLGKPANGPITGPPYTIYLFAETAPDVGHHPGGEYGVGLIQKGTVLPNEATGQLTTTFEENSQSPFSRLALKFNGGTLGPIANPLVCGTATSTVSLAPWSGNPASVFKPLFSVDSNGKGAPCASPLPFALSQSSEDHPTTGAANTSFTLNLSRSDGNQYLQRVSAKLPAGLVGKIPSVPLCPEPQASQGTCSTSSQIGTATVLSGSGASPTSFSGPVYLTGPYAGAPYGMTVVISTAVGPFNLGPVVVRATIEVEPLTGRVIVVSTLPTIVKGIPVRMKSMSVAINHPGFLINPTNCSLLAIESRLSSTFGATQLVSSPFQASACNTLSFKPKFGASVNAFASRANGASFAVSIGYPTGVQANIRSVVVRLPKQLPSRLDTLKKACPEAVFYGPNPYNCPPGSYVGGATVVTPVLPKPLSGRVFFVSHGGAAFPDIDMVLGGNGVVIILVGNTNISKGITTTTFASIPDAPVSSFHMNLPYGKFSALGGHGNLCAQPLIMPTTLTAQNGVVIKQNTRIAVTGCVKVLSHRVRGHKVTLTIKAAVAGRLRVGGGKLASVGVRVRKAGRVTVTVPLSAAGVRALKAHKPLNVSVLVRLTVSKSTSYSTSAKVRFR
jgi:hypothetical protein